MGGLCHENSRHDGLGLYPGLYGLSLCRESEGMTLAIPYALGGAWGCYY